MISIRYLFIILTCLMMCLSTQAQEGGLKKNATASLDTTPSSTNTKVSVNKTSSVRSSTGATVSNDEIITGEFHKANLKMIVGFKSPQETGDENPNEVIQTFEAGQPIYLTGYFQSDMKSTGGVPTFKMIYHDESTDKEYFQPMYVAEDKKAEVELKGTFQYAFFPKISTLNYDSHLAYIPYLNFAKWVSTLLPGTYDLDLVFGIRNEMARSSFKMIVTPESLRMARDYYDALYAKKVDAVTFPLASCQNKAGSIPNVADLSQYGKLLKVDYSQTGDIMFPWPRDHEVQYNTASGYGIFERNGTLEVIQLEFRKLPSASRFEFHAIGNRPTHLTMLCPNQMSIQPEILDYGYEMNKENLYICHPW